MVLCRSAQGKKHIFGERRVSVFCEIVFNADSSSGRTGIIDFFTRFDLACS